MNTALENGEPALAIDSDWLNAQIVQSISNWMVGREIKPSVLLEANRQMLLFLRGLYAQNCFVTDEQGLKVEAFGDVGVCVYFDDTNMIQLRYGRHSDGAGLRTYRGTDFGLHLEPNPITMLITASLH